MNTSKLPPINNKADFLANAELMVEESLEQYRQLADSMELHNNPDTAVQFRKLESMEQEQLEWIKQQMSGINLPEIAPWDFAWHCQDNPAKDCLSDMDYLVNPAKALSAALHNEYHTEAIYQKIAEQSFDPIVKNLAYELAEQQSAQIELLKRRIQALPKEAYETLEDMDPPNIPE